MADTGANEPEHGSLIPIPPLIQDYPQPKPIDVRRWLTRDRDKKIDKFIATAVLMRREFKPDDPTRKLIHWRGGGAYKKVLVRGREKWRSISFDTQKLGTDPVIEVQLISKSFKVSSVAPYYWESPLLREYTSRDVFDLLVAKKFNRYMYNGAGCGCLTWTTALVRLLEEEGVLPTGSEREFLLKVNEARADARYWVPEEPGAGFY
ncbi:hypothetical protein BKA83DRAFT_4246591 [Pisolithus microcarpus]|nr:hypothetical protein BKA83DRAFT_4340459 [Pisolithus microcarpus]KAI6026694.1 hypothetical protein BKA83DRAFT_4246591 [Pisolithus microcarpus]